MASIIDPTLAKSLIKEYQQQNSAPGGPAIMTSEQKYLNGFYIDRESIEAILTDPTFTGISVYLAKDKTAVASPQNIFTIIFIGAKPNMQLQAGGSGTPYVNGGDPYDNVEPCPTNCGDFAS